MDMGLWSERAAAGNAAAKLIHSDSVPSRVSPPWRRTVLKGWMGSLQHPVTNVIGSEEL